MAGIVKDFDITLTPEFTAYMQNLINTEWEGGEVIQPAFVIEVTTSGMLGSVTRLETMYSNGIGWEGYKLPGSTSTSINFKTTESESEEEPPTLTGHLVFRGQYNSTSNIVSPITFKIVAVRDTDL